MGSRRRSLVAEGEIVEALHPERHEISTTESSPDSGVL